MKSNYKAATLANQDSDRVRCNLNHSGNRRLTYDNGVFECNGCGTFHTIDSVVSALAGPVENYDGSGGIVRVK